MNCTAVWTIPETSFPASYTIMILFQIQPALTEKERFMKEYRCLRRPAAGYLKHAVVISSIWSANWKRRLQNFILYSWSVWLMLCKVLLRLCFCVTRAPAPRWLYGRGGRIIKPGAPVSLLFLTATFTINLHKGVQSGCDLMTYFLPWEALHQARVLITCAVMQESSFPNLIGIDV